VRSRMEAVTSCRSKRVRPHDGHDTNSCKTTTEGGGESREGASTMGYGSREHYKRANQSTGGERMDAKGRVKKGEYRRGVWMGGEGMGGGGWGCMPFLVLRMRHP